VGRFHGYVWGMDADNKGEESMMDLSADGRDVRIRLRDDVWQMEEPGTLYLTRQQAYYLRAHLNAFGNAYFDDEPEDG
jgi:hypothetical protein